MQKIGQSILHGDLFAFDGVGLIALFAFWFVLRALLTPGQRTRLRMPLVFLVGYIVITLWLDLVPHPPKRHVYLDAFAVMLLLLAIGRLLSVFVLDWLIARRLNHDTPKIVRDIAEGLLVIVALLVTLRTAGVDPSSLLTTSALLTAIVGLSLQDTLGNLFAGLSLQAQQPFNVGEWIQLDKEGQQIGQVIEVNWRATKLRTSDNGELVIPNGQLARSVILNHSRPTRAARRTLTLSVPYEFSTRTVHELAMRSMANLPGVLPTPEPTVLTGAFQDFGIEYKVRYFVQEFDRREAIDSVVRDRLLYALQRAGMPIATPNHRVQMEQLSADPQRFAQDRSLQARTRAIRSIDFLKDLPDDVMAKLAVGTRSELYEPGEVVVRQGDHGGELYLCLSGELVVLHAPEGGQRQEVARLTHGGMFGELSLMTGEPRTATVQAVSPCELLVIGKNVFAEVLAGNPNFVDLISERLAERQAALEALERAVSPSEHRASVESQKGQLLRRVRDFFAI
jgi:small-conductance mechanosensitive channel/CRP-like cAMP-binding protein